MAERPGYRPGRYGFESRWVHVFNVIWWSIYGALFLWIDRSRPTPLWRLSTYWCFSVAAFYAAGLDRLAFGVSCMWLAVVLVVTVHDWVKIRSMRKQGEADLLAAQQREVASWPCPRCGVKDFRVLPPVLSPIVECAECGYRVPDLAPGC